MEDTWFLFATGKAGRLVPVQSPKDGQWVRFPVTFYDPDYPVKGAKTFYSGGAGLSSSARDTPHSCRCMSTAANSMAAAS